jgi:NADP-dependent 3-hydroxy acid dehydrogenase YdfG
MSKPSKAVLITGCSSGIGEATALRLVGHGWTVYASARRPETIEHLAAAGCHTLALDVTDERSMGAAVETVQREQGAVGVLINNAGYSQSGAVEQVPLEAVRRQFETNVFGLIAMTQLVLPAMRSQHWGKVVNIGSMGGRMTFPGGGLYHATKYAVEALSDALRFEVRGFGVDVVLIEPGLIVTKFAETAVAAAPASSIAAPASSTADTFPVGTAASSTADTPSVGAADASLGASATVGAPTTVAAGATAEETYRVFEAKVSALTTGVYEGPMRHLGGGPEVVAKAIEKAIKRRRPPARMLVTPSARMSVLQRRLLPDRAWDTAMRTQFPQPR